MEKSGYRLPRWEEMPAIDLYLDQVLFVVEDALKNLLVGEQKMITSTMVNNYVKFKLISPTEKKKYSKSHVTELIEITLLKQVLSTAEILQVMAELKDGREDSAAYGLFCDELEKCLSGGSGTRESGAAPKMAEAAIRALAGKIEFKRLAAEKAAQEDEPKEEKHKEEKE